MTSTLNIEMDFTLSSDQLGFRYIL